MSEEETLRRVARLADTWQADLDRGSIRDPRARYCWTLAVRELRAAIGAERPGGAA